MEEAAMVDGCSRLGAIRRTLLPLSYPGLIGAGLYTFLLAWNEFLFAVVLIEAWEKRVNDRLAGRSGPVIWSRSASRAKGPSAFGSRVGMRLRRA